MYVNKFTSKIAGFLGKSDPPSFQKQAQEKIFVILLGRNSIALDIACYIIQQHSMKPAVSA